MKNCNGTGTLIIDDGYSQPFYVAEEPGLYPAFRGQCRPCHWHERETLRLTLGEKLPQEAQPIVAAAMAKRILALRLADGERKPVPRDAASILKFHPVAFWRLFQIVGGYEAGDLDPEQAPEQTKSRADAALAAMEKGVSPVDAGQEADAKN